MTSQHRAVAGGGSGGLVVGERLYLPYAPAVDPSRSQEEEGRLPLVLREPFHFELQEDICGETHYSYHHFYRGRC